MCLERTTIRLLTRISVCFRGNGSHTDCASGSAVNNVAEYLESPKEARCISSGESKSLLPEKHEEDAEVERGGRWELKRGSMDVVCFCPNADKGDSPQQQPCNLGCNCSVSNKDHLFQNDSRKDDCLTNLRETPHDLSRHCQVGSRKWNTVADIKVVHDHDT